MPKKLFSIFKYLVFLGLGIFLTWWQLGKMDAEQQLQFKESLLHANYIVILPVVIMSLLSHLSRAIRWRLLIEPMGYRPGIANAFFALMTGYFANTFIPRAGEVLRCTLLSKHERIPFSKLIGTILLERVFDLFCYVIVIFITILIQIATVSDFVKKTFAGIFEVGNSSERITKILIIVFILAGGVLYIRWLFKRYADHRHIIKIRSASKGLKEGFSTILHLRKRRLFLLHTLFIWSMYLMQIYIGFQSLDQTSSLTLNAAFSILSLATLAMIISPGGIGAFPVAVQQVLLIYDVDNISFGWLMWGTTTAIVIVAGVLSFILLTFINNKRNESSPEHPA